MFFYDSKTTPSLLTRRRQRITYERVYYDFMVTAAFLAAFLFSSELEALMKLYQHAPLSETSEGTTAIILEIIDNNR